MDIEFVCWPFLILRRQYMKLKKNLFIAVILGLEMVMGFNYQFILNMYFILNFLLL